MKKIFNSLLLILFLFSTQTFGQEIQVMSFNIRIDVPGDNENQWSNRKNDVGNMIRRYNPDILGLQEGLLHQLKHIKKYIPHYSMIGKGREDGNTGGEYTAIFYDTIKLQLLSQSTYWLSDQDDIVSLGWDAAYKRTCTYGLFMDKRSNESFYLFNTHFDHIGEEARLKSAELIVKKIEAINAEHLPVILMGDFNCEVQSEPIQILLSALSDGMNKAKKPFKGPEGTFNGFDLDENPVKRIDYIFIKDLEVLKYEHIDDRMKNGNLISDHFPVFTEIVLNDFKK